MLLPKLNTVCEEIKNSLFDKKNPLMSKQKSVDPAPQKAEPNKSLSDKADKYFNEKDDTRTEQKNKVPEILTRKYDKNHKRLSK